MQRACGLDRGDHFGRFVGKPGRSIPYRPPNNPDCTEETGDQEGRPPTKVQGNPRDCEGSKDGSDTGAGVEDARSKSPLLGRKPFRGGLDGRGKIAALAQAEQEPRHAKAENRIHEGMAHRCQAPKSRHNGIALAAAEPVDQSPGKDDSKRISNLKAARMLPYCTSVR